jgi:quercetin dioxygenase-like cupin family protein
MRKELIIEKPVDKEQKRSAREPLRPFDLPALIEKMKRSNTYEKGELNAMILLKGPHKQIVLTALHEGTEISSFQANDSVTFQIIEGKLGFHTRKKSVTLDKGQLLTLSENIKYNLTTSEETVFLLTIVKDTLRSTECS